MAALLRLPRSMLAFGLSSLLLLPNTCSATCFTPNGTDRNTMFNETPPYQYYAPCSPEAKFSMCCNLNGDGDVCLPNGLCNNTGSGLYWRESCTDITWADPACLKLYLNGTEGPDAKISDVTVTPCPDGSWCHGNGKAADDCCLAGEGYFVVNGIQTKTNPNTTTTTTPSSSSLSSSTLSSSSASSSALSSSSASSATPTTSASAPAQASSAPTSSPQGSGGRNVGIGVGVGVGVALLLIAIGVFLYFRKARRSRARRWDERDGPTDQKPAELLSYKDATELPSSNGRQLRGSQALDPHEMGQPDAHSAMNHKSLPNDKIPTVELE